MNRDRLVFAAAALGTLGMVGPARALAASLREAGMLGPAVTAAFAVTVLVLGFVVWGERPSSPSTAGPWQDPRARAAVLGVTGIAAAALFSRWSLPEERVHLVIYGLLGWLAWRAVGAGAWRSAVAVVLTALVGFADEVVQGLHPERQFDWMDVLANGAGGSIAPLLLSRAPWLAPVVLGGLALLFAPIQRAIGLGPVEGPGPSSRQAPMPPAKPGAYAGYHVVLVTIDALRADHAPPLGGQVATPSMAGFAAQGVAFSSMWAGGSWTSPGVVSLLTGLHPAVHGVNARGLDVGPGPELPLEALMRAGWIIRGHAGDATENYRNLGVRVELDRSDEARAVGELLESSTGPVFAWVHLRDVHAPYSATPERLAELGLPSDLPKAPILERARMWATVPRAGFPGRHDWLRPAIRALYAAEVADADAAFGRVLAEIEASGHGRRTIVILTADHGEELLEADGIGHASTTLDSVPREELQRIPLVVRWPDGRGAGTSTDVLMRQQDLMPSLLPLLGVQLEAWSADAWLVGVDRSAALVGAAGVAGADAEASPSGTASGRQTSGEDASPNWFLTSPCGWQCPADRRDERVAAVNEAGVWSWCRFEVGGEDTCEEALAAPLRAGKALGASLGTPLAEPGRDDERAPIGFGDP